MHDCGPSQVCIDTLGSFICRCAPGYRRDGLSLCIDNDECFTGVHGCHVHSDCTNTDGSYTCECHNWFEGDGKMCNDIDECKGENPCGEFKKCINQSGKFRCVCEIGFKLGNERIEKFCTLMSYRSLIWFHIRKVPVEHVSIWMSVGRNVSKKHKDWVTFVTNVTKIHFVLIMSDHITVNVMMDTKVMDIIVKTRMIAKILGNFQFNSLIN